MPNTESQIVDTPATAHRVIVPVPNALHLPTFDVATDGDDEWYASSRAYLRDGRVWRSHDAYDAYQARQAATLAKWRADGCHPLTSALDVTPLSDPAVD